MRVNKLIISPIYTGPGISKRANVIEMNDVPAKKAAQYIKERLYLTEDVNAQPVNVKPYVNPISEFLSRFTNKG